MPIPQAQLPNYTINPPAAPDPLAKYGQMLQLKNMLGQQQMLPLDLQEKQQQIQSQQQTIQGQQLQNQRSTIENQIAQVGLQNTQRANDYWENPSKYQSDSGAGSGSGASSTSTTPATSAPAGFAENMLGLQSDDPLAKQINGLIRAGVNPTIGDHSAISIGNGLMEFRKTVQAQVAAGQDIAAKGAAQLKSILTPIAAEKDPAKQTSMIQDAEPELQKASAFDPSLHQMLMSLDVAHLPKVINAVGGLKDIAEYTTAQASALKAKQSADPLFALENDPAEMTGDKAPAAVAMLTSKLTNPKTAPEDLPRVQRLLGQAKSAVQSNLNFEAAKERAKEAISEGDPKAAAQLLVSGMVAPSELVSSRRPAFAQQALSYAQTLSPNWNAQKADADFNIAKSPANQQFFGSANSLINKGGTLDQLAVAGQGVPKGKFPALNSIQDYLSKQWGDPATAAYASTALGVADDYAKVMGGGAGSDTSRLQVLHALSAAQSPEQRAAVLQNVRNAVQSQRDSRIGSNSVMKQMYGGAAEPAAAAAKSGQGSGAAAEITARRSWRTQDRGTQWRMG